MPLDISMLDELQPHLHRLFHHLSHIVHMQLAHQVVTMKLYGVGADVQLLGNGIGGMSIRNIFQDFQLSTG